RNVNQAPDTGKSVATEKDGWRERLMANNLGAIPLRQFGRHQVRISALGFGGHHLGDAPDERTAVGLVREAVDAGITFFDNCWEYHDGLSEERLGRALKGRRDSAVVMTKVCTHGRDRVVAMRQLEESLTRLQTDRAKWRGGGPATSQAAGQSAVSRLHR